MNKYKLTFMSPDGKVVTCKCYFDTLTTIITVMVADNYILISVNIKEAK